MMTFAGLGAACLLNAQIAPPRAAALIERALAVNKAQDEKGWKYTFREDSDQWQWGRNRERVAEHRKTYEHIMLEGSDYKKLILIDGQSLDAKTQKKVDADLEKARAARRKHSDKSLFEYSGSLDLLARLFDNSVTGEETVLGRKTWRLESEPKRGYKAANRREEQLLMLRETIWFDQQDGAEIKERDVFLETAKGFPPGTIVEMEFAKIGEAWLLDNLTFHLSFGGIHSRLYDYKRFTVDSTLAPR